MKIWTHPSHQNPAYSQIFPGNLKMGKVQNGWQVRENYFFLPFYCRLGVDSGNPGRYKLHHSQRQTAIQMEEDEMELTLCIWAFVFFLCALFVLVEHCVAPASEYESLSKEELAYIKERIEEALRCK